MTKPKNPIFAIKNIAVSALFLLVLVALTRSAGAQVAPTMDRRPQATRAELEAALAEIDKITAPSSAYSETLKRQKRSEAVMIRDRLRDGDFQVGDQIKLTLTVPITTTSQPVNGQPVTVGPGQMLQIPDLPPIPMHGVLRSEVQAYLTEYMSRLFKDQTVTAIPTIRLTISGGVKQPGFYQLPADTPLPDAITQAGGFGAGTELNKTVVKRSNEEIWGEEDMYKSIIDAVTLDQLNLRSGDELIIGQKTTTNWLTNLRTYALIPGLILSLAALGKLLGII
ncbi:MAG: SLBB domain-containing protein [Gemmatimonadota bacterium]